MNLTDDGQMVTLMGALFDEVLLPLARRMQERGVQAFPLEPDVAWLSYYVRRKRAAMTRADFSGASCVDAVDLQQRLAQHWQALGRHELAASAAHFAAAAGAARVLMAAAAPEAEVSPYVYAMF